MSVNEESLDKDIFITVHNNKRYQASFQLFRCRHGSGRNNECFLIS